MVSAQNAQWYINVEHVIENTMLDDDNHACDCGETFDTLDELKSHAKENHPETYEEKFDDE